MSKLAERNRVKLTQFLPERKNAAAAGRENVHHWFLCKPALGGQKPLAAMPIRASFCRRTGACRSLLQPLFRISRNQGVTHTTLQAKSCAKGRCAPLETHADYVRQRLLFINFITCALSTGIVYGHSNNRTWFSTQILRFLWSSSCRFFNPSSPPKKSTAS